ncbi:MAG: 3'-5' exonuclease [Bacteroidota bacterium]
MRFDFWNRKKDHPEFWREYLAVVAKKRSPQTPIDALDFVVFDTETTGLDTKMDKLLTIGALRLQGKRIDLADGFETRILQRDNYQTAAIPIHGIVPDKEKGLPPSEALQRFVKYLGNSILVGHNVGFDLQMINRGLLAMDGGKLKNAYLDTAKLAIRVEHLQPSSVLDPRAFTLDALCQRYGIRMHDRHNAAGDALLTAILLLKLLAQLKKRGVNTWRDLRRR